MTYLELIETANHKLDTNKITLGEYEEMIAPLKREMQPNPDCALKEFGDCSYSETGCSDCAVKVKIRNALSVQSEPCEDAVRREDVQSIAEKSDWFESSDSFNDFMWALYELPSAQPERKKGRWLRYGEDGYPNNEDTVFWQCDQCLEQYTGRAKKIPNFCPNCGADMRGGDAE